MADQADSNFVPLQTVWKNGKKNNQSPPKARQTSLQNPQENPQNTHPPEKGKKTKTSLPPKKQ